MRIFYNDQWVNEGVNMKLVRRLTSMSLASVVLLSTIGEQVAAESLFQQETLSGVRDCAVTAFTDTDAVWRVTSSHLNGEAVFVIEGTGEGRVPMTVVEGSLTFQTNTYLLIEYEVTRKGEKIDISEKRFGGTIYNNNGLTSVFGDTIAGEDGEDGDWQDMVLTITCRMLR